MQLLIKLPAGEVSIVSKFLETYIVFTLLLNWNIVYQSNTKNCPNSYTMATLPWVKSADTKEIAGLVPAFRIPFNLKGLWMKGVIKPKYV